MKALKLIRENEIAEVFLDYKPKKTGIKVRNSDQALDYIRPFWKQINYVESGCVILMSNASEVLGHVFIGKGGPTGVVIDPRTLFQTVLLSHAQRFIVIHNHPSGNLTPSNQDLGIRDRISTVADALTVSFDDFLIISDHDHISCRT